MKKIILVILLVISFSGAVFATNIRIRDININNNIEYSKDEIIVKFKSTDNQEEIENIHSLMRTSNINANTDIKRVRIPEGSDALETVEIFRNIPSIEYAHLNYICNAHSIPNDPLYSYQWNFTLINMEEAWNIQPNGSENIIVAILDTGIAYEDYGPYLQAQDLSGTIFCYPYDFINNDSHANDDEGHGTHMAGTICQSTGNGYGVAGMAYGVQIMPIKVLNSSGKGSSTHLAEGIYWAVNHGANIINMSLGYNTDITPEDIPQVTEAIEYAYTHNVIMIASSGNSGTGIVSYPAAYPQVISVGAVHSGDELTSYSQYGINLELVAPGGDIFDRDWNDYTDGVLQETFSQGNPTDFGFWFYAGTSSAASHVSGLAVLLLAKNPSRTIFDIRNILHITSVDLGKKDWDEKYGYGRIDAYYALNYNNSPIAQDQLITIDEDSVKGIILTATDTDNDPLTYTIATNPAHGTLADTVPNLTYTPAANYNGVDGFTFRTNDGKLDSNTATVFIIIIPFNDPPTISGIPDTTVYQDMHYIFTPVAEDIDGDTILFSITNRPGWASFDPNTGTLEGTPVSRDVGTTTNIVITVSDNELDTSLQAFDLTVINNNDSSAGCFISSL